jgi:hypothetical protein
LRRRRTRLPHRRSSSGADGSRAERQRGAFASAVFRSCFPVLQPRFPSSHSRRSLAFTGHPIGGHRPVTGGHAARRLSGPYGRAEPAASAPAPEQPSAQNSGLASIAAAIERLPTETPAAGTKEAEKPAPNQLALNTRTKPVYGPKFETAKDEADKPAIAEKKAEAAKPAPKKDEPKAAAAKKDEDKKALASKEEAKPLLRRRTLPRRATRRRRMRRQEGRGRNRKSAKAKKEEPKETSRHWVQIAGGANEAAMTREFLRLKAKAPKLLATRTAWTTPLRATNRLLVGPFKSADEAQEFVNELAKLDLPAFSWTSPAGQEIVKLASK